MSLYHADKVVGGLHIQARLDLGFISAVEDRLHHGLPILVDIVNALDVTRRECAAIISLACDKTEDEVLAAINADEDENAGLSFAIELFKEGLDLPKKAKAAEAANSTSKDSSDSSSVS